MALPALEVRLIEADTSVHTWKHAGWRLQVHYKSIDLFERVV